MKFFKDYSCIDKDKDEPDYAFINVGDTCDIIRITNNGKNISGYFHKNRSSKYNVYVDTVLDGGYDNKFVDAQHEAAENMNFETENYTKYAQLVPKTAFLNDDGFVDNLGNFHEASEDNQGNISLYQVAKLTPEGKELLKKYKNLSTSTYYNCHFDEEEAKKHGLENALVTITSVQPLTVSFLYGDLEPKVKIAPNEKYVTNSDEKKTIFSFFGKNEDFLGVNLSDKTQNLQEDEKNTKKMLDNKNSIIVTNDSYIYNNMSEKKAKNTEEIKEELNEVSEKDEEKENKNKNKTEEKKENDNKNEKDEEKENKNKNEEDEKKESENKNVDNNSVLTYLIQIRDIVLRIEKSLSNKNAENDEDEKKENNNKNETEEKKEKKDETLDNKNNSLNDDVFNINFDFKF